MPSVLVTPEALASSPLGGPVLAGIRFPRPSSMGDRIETVRATVELASGSTRTYDKGTRRVFTLSWRKLPTDVFLALQGVVRSPVISFDHPDGGTFVVETGEGVEGDAVPGTYPIRYSANLTLRERDVTP